MAFTTDQLTALRDALARGVLEAVLPDGSRIRYRSVAEMEQIISKIETDLGQRVTHTNVSYPSHRRGYDS